MLFAQPSFLSPLNLAVKGSRSTSITSLSCSVFGDQLNRAQVIQVSEGSANDELTIKYHHCGKVGKNRVLTLKDGQDKVLKEIKFEDVSTPSAGMSCRVKDIVSFKKGSTNTVKLYYTSSELPGGRLLASIITGNNTASVQP